MPSRYEERGVSSSKEEVHAAVAGLNKGLYPGAFTPIMPYNRERHAVKHSDGAGSKAALAYLAWRHGFPVSIMRGISQDSGVMNFDDIGCVGAIHERIYLTQIINRNPFRIPGEVIAELIKGNAEFCALMQKLGFDVVLCGGETADLGDQSRTVTVDSDIFTTVIDKHVINASRIKIGDVIIGFSSTGQAQWEEEPNSGIGSNGLTNARHDVLHPDYRADTETYAPEMPKNRVYCGKYHLEDPLPGDNRFTIASALLSPTRTYLPLISELFQVSREGIHALIHCSGGGQTKIGKFGPKEALYYKDDLLPTPPLFVFLQEARRLPWKEMFSTYNMGHRLEAVVPANLASAYIDASQRYCGIEAKVIGEVRRRRGNTRLWIKSEHGTFRY